RRAAGNRRPVAGRRGDEVAAGNRRTARRTHARLRRAGDALPRNPRPARSRLRGVRAGAPVPGLRGLRGVLLRLIRLPAGPLPRPRIDLDAQHRVAVDAAVAEAARLARTVDHAEDGLDRDVQYPLHALRTTPLHRAAAPPWPAAGGPTREPARPTRPP